MVESSQSIDVIPTTPDEDKAIAKLKETLEKQKFQYDDKRFNNSYLVRFLRARKLKVDKAAIMFKNFIKWREDNKIDEIPKMEFTEMPQMKVIYPSFFHKLDKLGRPIYIELAGRINVGKMFEISSPERLLLMNLQHQERILNQILPSCSKALGRNVHQLFSLVDLRKFNSKLVSKKIYEFLKISLGNSQNYYPEVLGALFIVNSSLVFKACWAVVKAFLDEKTKKKITMCGSDYKKKLLKHVDPENLPSFIQGGECKCEPYGCMVSNPGPWNPDKEITKIDTQLYKEIGLNLQEEPTEEELKEGQGEEVEKEEDKLDEENEEAKPNDSD